MTLTFDCRLWTVILPDNRKNSFWLKTRAYPCCMHLNTTKSGCAPHPTTSHPKPWLRPEPGQGQPYLAALAWPVILLDQGFIKPGQAGGFRPKPGQQITSVNAAAWSLPVPQGQEYIGFLIFWSTKIAIDVQRNLQSTSSIRWFTRLLLLNQIACG